MESCGIYDNYAPRKVHVSGLRVRPYSIVMGTNGGVKYANGQTYVSGNLDGQSNGQPAPAVVNTPSCQKCSS